MARVYRYANGNTYQGAVVNEKKTGPGVLTYAAGHVYEGLSLDCVDSDLISTIDG